MKREEREMLLKRLAAKREEVQKELVLAGFDGYIDKLVRLKKNQNRPTEYYNTVMEFAQFVAAREKQSSDIEVRRVDERIGGNGPLFALGIAQKGIPCVCIGAFGMPELNGYYRAASQVSWQSVAETAQSYAMEFQDGKLMFGDSESFYDLDWKKIREKICEEQLMQWFLDSKAVMFANWSGLPHSNDILRGITEDICPRLDGRQRILFFDLADPSPKGKEQFAEFFEWLKKLQRHFRIVMGLNEKEFYIVYNRFFERECGRASVEVMEELLAAMPVDELVIHVLDKAYAGDGSSPMQAVESCFVENPKIVTGGGDNFNAGYVMGKLLALPPAQCAYLGNISSMLYVKNGAPPDYEAMEAHIEKFGIRNESDEGKGMME